MTITRVEKSLGPWGWGLVGYEGDKLKVVLPVDIKKGKGARWIHSPVTAKERREVQEAANF